MVWVIVFLVLAAACLIVMGVMVEKDDRPLVIVCGMGIAYFTFMASIFLFANKVDEKPIAPILDDVPDKAHIDTTITIHGSDTTYSYELVWNEK